MDVSAESGVFERDFDFLEEGTRKLFSLVCSLAFFLSSFSASASAASAARVLRALAGTGGGFGRVCLPLGVARSSGGILRSRISAAEGGSALLMSSSRGTLVVGLLLRVIVIEGCAFWTVPDDEAGVDGLP